MKGELFRTVKCIQSDVDHFTVGKEYDVEDDNPMFGIADVIDNNGRRQSFVKRSCENSNMTDRGLQTFAKFEKVS